MKDIQEIYQDRRKQNKINLDKRIEEVCEKIPQVCELNSEIMKNNRQALRLSLEGKDSTKAQKKSLELMKKRDNLLLENNIPLDYIQMQYHCDICKDTGVVGLEECVCKKKLKIQKLHEQSQINEIVKRQNFENFNMNLFRKLDKTVK